MFIHKIYSDLNYYPSDISFVSQCTYTKNEQGHKNTQNLLSIWFLIYKNTHLCHSELYVPIKYVNGWPNINQCVCVCVYESKDIKMMCPLLRQQITHMIHKHTRIQMTHKQKRLLIICMKDCVYTLCWWKVSYMCVCFSLSFSWKQHLYKQGIKYCGFLCMYAYRLMKGIYYYLYS